MRADTIPARLLKQATLRPTAAAYYVKRNGAWRGTDWLTFVREVRQAARALMALGLRPGDKVAILGFNRPEWVIFNLGAMCAGGVGAGIYTTSSADEVRYIVHHSEARVVLVENEHQWAKIAAQREHLPLLEHVVMMRGGAVIDDPLLMSWQELEARGAEVTETELDARVDELDLSATATLIYTSGTTGPPKGIMLSHANVAWTANVLSGLINGSEYDSALSYLPLSHIAEQMLTIHGPATTGATVYYAEALDKVADNLREMQPTTIFGVPRIWEKFHAAVSAKLAKATGAQKWLVEWVRRVCTQVNNQRNRSQEPGLALTLQYKLANRLLLSKLKRALGLANSRMCVAGAAPISPEILEYFASLDIVIYEIYGQSEGCGPTSLNVPGKTKFGTVGVPIPGLEVKIAADGEILLRGPNVFIGYYKDEDATRLALQDGWLHSGDLGAFDDDGFLTITGRKKDIIITAGGKNIAPKNIEAALKNNSLISEAVVIGERRKYLTALITLDEEAADELLRTQGLPPRPADESPELRAAVQAVVDQTNTHLAQAETIKKFTILHSPFSVDSEELTPTLKVKRKVVNDKYQAEIEAMYEDS